MSETPDVSHLQWTVYWEREYTTALAPERLKLDFHPHRPLMTNMPLHEQRALAADGYKVLPDDCGPVRMVGQYGWLVRCPVDCKIRRTKDGLKWQAPEILPEERLLGYKSFSGMYVDTILNSGYAKLCCGIRFYYPKQLGIMLKDIPNHFYHYPERTFSVWEGIKSQEYKLTPQFVRLPSGLRRVRGQRPPAIGKTHDAEARRSRRPGGSRPAPQAVSIGGTHS